MARFGHLLLNRGRWNGRGPGVYGYNWWANGLQPDGHRRWPGSPPSTFCAIGFNNNRMFVIPEWNMVIVHLGVDGDSGSPGEPVYQRFLRMVGEARKSRKAKGKGRGKRQVGPWPKPVVGPA